MPLSKAATQLGHLLKPVPPPMTQQGLAEKLGVTQQAVSAWLRGVTRPEYETRMKIADLLGVPVEDWKVDESADSGSTLDDTAESRPTGTSG